MKEILLWIPTANVRPESWLQVEGYMNQRLPDGYSLRFRTSKPSRNVTETWNGVVSEFLASGAEWLWGVHDDIVTHPYTLERLLSWDKKLVSGLVFHRKYPALPHIWIEGKDELQQVEETKRWFMAHQDYIITGPVVMQPRPEDALVEASWSSTSCVLIHRSVLEDMGGNWFSFEGDGERAYGEDVRFYKTAKQAGHQLYVDRSVVAGHLFGIQPTGAMDFMLWEYHPLFTATMKGLSYDSLCLSNGI